MSRTNINLLIELQEHLTNGGFITYLDKMPQDIQDTDKYNVDRSLKPYIILKATPFNLLRSDKLACNNNRAVRTGNVFVSCYAEDRISSGNLADEVDNYLCPDDNSSWHCTDGTPLETYGSWSVDNSYTTSEQNIFITNLAYRCKKNLPLTQ
jgi:hypothetical protein